MVQVVFWEVLSWYIDSVKNIEKLLQIVILDFLLFQKNQWVLLLQRTAFFNILCDFIEYARIFTFRTSEKKDKASRIRQQFEVRID